MTKIEMTLIGCFLAVALVVFLDVRRTSRAAPALMDFMERCAAVGFTAEQCRFMHGG